MITSEAGKALIQTCLEKDESIIESPSTTTTLNDNDVIFVEENQRKKQINLSKNGKSY
jgi:K+/H+ antiporter YhaU regulatory subunit KhtT